LTDLLPLTGLLVAGSGPTTRVRCSTSQPAWRRLWIRHGLLAHSECQRGLRPVDQFLSSRK